MELTRQYDYRISIEDNVVCFDGEAKILRSSDDVVFSTLGLFTYEEIMKKLSGTKVLSIKGEFKVNRTND